MENYFAYRGPRPDPDRIPHEDEMRIIQRTCDAEQFSRDLLAPYNPEPTVDQLRLCLYDISAALMFQIDRGEHCRMDVVLSLSRYRDAIKAKLALASAALPVTQSTVVDAAPREPLLESA